MIQLILFFDGGCLVCNKFIQFVFNRNKKRDIWYSRLDSIEAISHNLMPDSKTMVLYFNGKYYMKSAALVQILEIIDFPPIILFLIKLVPSFIADCFYHLFSNNRYIFGRVKSCDISINQYILL